MLPDSSAYVPGLYAIPVCIPRQKVELHLCIRADQPVTELRTQLASLSESGVATLSQWISSAPGPPHLKLVRVESHHGPPTFAVINLVRLCPNVALSIDMSEAFAQGARMDEPLLQQSSSQVGIFPSRYCDGHGLWALANLPPDTIVAEFSDLVVCSSAHDGHRTPNDSQFMNSDNELVSSRDPTRVSLAEAINEIPPGSSVAPNVRFCEVIEHGKLSIKVITNSWVAQETELLVGKYALDYSSDIQGTHRSANGFNTNNDSPIYITFREPIGNLRQKFTVQASMFDSKSTQAILDMSALADYIEVNTWMVRCKDVRSINPVRQSDEDVSSGTPAQFNFSCGGYCGFSRRCLYGDPMSLVKEMTATIDEIRIPLNTLDRMLCVPPRPRKRLFRDIV